MSDPLVFSDVPLEDVRVLLLDADDCLFPSETPAFAASTTVTNRLLADLGIDRRFEAEELRRIAAGRNFRANARALAAEHGARLDEDELDRRVEEERREVTRHLAETLRPDPAVREPLAALAARFELAVVSSSALRRLDACFEATGLADLLPAGARYSAEDSLPEPTSKPDPAVYLHAAAERGVAGGGALAVEDSVSGTRSGIAAGLPVIGNVMFVAPDEREERIARLREAGAFAVVFSWWQVVDLLGAQAAAA